MIARKVQKLIYNILILCFLIGGAIYVCSRFIHLGNIEYTDNAQVKQHITPINTRVPGFIKKICFEEYQQVRKGDTLLIIEDTEFRLRVAQAEALKNIIFAYIQSHNLPDIFHNFANRKIENRYQDETKILSNSRSL